MLLNCRERCLALSGSGSAPWFGEDGGFLINTKSPFHFQGFYRSPQDVVNWGRHVELPPHSYDCAIDGIDLGRSPAQDIPEH